MVIGAFVLDLFPKAALAEMAGFGFTLGFDFFHVCGYTVIIIIIIIIEEQPIYLTLTLHRKVRKPEFK